MGESSKEKAVGLWGGFIQKCSLFLKKVSEEERVAFQLLAPQFPYIHALSQVCHYPQTLF